jgi:hypothetical protein
MPVPRPILTASLALAAAFAAAPAEVRAADLPTACAPEIQRLCANVRHGRGRVTACLASQAGELGAACRASVRSVSRNPLTPAWARAAFSSRTAVALPSACTAPAEQYCPGMAPNATPVFACLYAYSDRVPASCTKAAEATLKQAR